MSDAEYFDFVEFPTLAVGGPPGDYVARVPVPSNEEVHFMIMSVANGATNVSTVTVTTHLRGFAADFSGVGALSDTTAFPGFIFRCPTQNTVIPNPAWERVENDTGEVYVHVAGGVASFVMIKFRVKLLKKIPAPFKTVAPEDEKLVHAMREKRIQEAVLAQAGEEYVYGNEPPKQPIIEPITATTAPRTKLGYWGKIIR